MNEENLNFDQCLHYSAGGIVLYYKENNWNYLILHQVRKDCNKWAFPRGHIESNDSVLHTAEREIFEETGLNSLQFITHLGVEVSHFQWKNLGDEYWRNLGLNPHPLLPETQHTKINHWLLFISTTNKVQLAVNEGFIDFKWLDFNENSIKNEKILTDSQRNFLKKGLNFIS
jgi:8-oxo-dGTP pyrophosphatase MutT (NUDIX family)